MNLFLRTRSLTNSKEDHLTEFFAAALESNKTIRELFAKKTLESFAKRNQWSYPVITEIRTQVTFKDANSRPDMLLILSDGHTILCEHKLEAIETPGSLIDDRLQLERYLSLPVDGLIYVRSNWKPPSNEVLNHQKYISHENREHFLWRDFYELFINEDDFISLTMKAAFEFLGFNPPHPFIGDLSGTPDGKNDLNRRNFAKFWLKTRSFLRNLGWRVTTGSVVELYLSNGPSELSTNVYITPWITNRFMIRFTPSRNNIQALSDKLALLIEESSWSLELSKTIVKRIEGKVEVVDLTTSLEEVIGKTNSDPKQIEESLFRFVSYFLSEI